MFFVLNGEDFFFDFAVFNGVDYDFILVSQNTNPLVIKQQLFNIMFVVDLIDFLSSFD